MAHDGQRLGVISE